MIICTINLNIPHIIQVYNLQPNSMIGRHCSHFATKTIDCYADSSVSPSITSPDLARLFVSGGAGPFSMH